MWTHQRGLGTFLACALMLFAPSWAGAALTDGLVSHLPLDGNAAAGLAGTGGTVSGAVNFSPGKFGQAAGVTNYRDGYIPLNDDLGAAFGTSTDFSMSVWMYYDGYSSDPAFLSNKNWGSGGNTGINVAFNPSHKVDFNTKANTGSRRDIHTANNSLTPGTWQNIIFTVDRDGPTNLYINGAPAGTIATTSPGSFDGAYNWALLNDGTGTYPYGSTTAGLKMDEFAAWNRILTGPEIATLQTTSLSPAPPPPPPPVTLFSEDFEGLPLRPFVSGTEGGGDGTDWTDVPPPGWVRDNTTTPSGPPPEFFGWTFLDKNSWVATEGNQNRAQFALGQGTVMVADPDAFDDGTNVDPNLFNAFMMTPPIDLSGVQANSVVLEFDSSFRPYSTQTGTVDVSFDGGATFTNLLTKLGGPDTIQQWNEHIALNINNPATGQMVLRFGMTNAGNDWWWSADNVLVTGQPGAAGDIPEPATLCLLGAALAGLGGYVRRRRRA